MVAARFVCSLITVADITRSRNFYVAVIFKMHGNAQIYAIILKKQSFVSIKIKISHTSM